MHNPRYYNEWRKNWYDRPPREKTALEGLVLLPQTAVLLGGRLPAFSLEPAFHRTPRGTRRPPAFRWMHDAQQHGAEFLQAVLRIARRIAKTLARHEQLALGRQPIAVFLQKPLPHRFRQRGGCCATAHRSTALLLTLLTFCPPGPLLRAKVISNSASGICSWRVTMSIGADRVPRKATSPL